MPDPSAIAAITAAAKSYGYDPGSVSRGELAQSTQKTYLAKVDGNISQDQRATFTYRRVDGSTPTFADYSGSTETSYSNHWYESNRINDNYSVQLNRTWTPNLLTDAGLALIKYNGTASPSGPAFLIRNAACVPASAFCAKRNIGRRNYLGSSLLP